MGKETAIFIIAQNGLKTAALLFTAKAAKLDKQVATAEGDQSTSKLNKSATKVKKLASILIAAGEGVISYRRESES